MDEKTVFIDLQTSVGTDGYSFLLTYIDLLAAQLHKSGALNGHQLAAAMRQQAAAPQPEGVAFFWRNGRSTCRSASAHWTSPTDTRKQQGRGFFHRTHKFTG